MKLKSTELEWKLFLTRFVTDAVVYPRSMKYPFSPTNLLILNLLLFSSDEFLCLTRDQKNLSAK